ncbi:fibronectin type III domain-containing protein [Aequorivita marisscotiae]|uniref:Fibronectin type III domain-containing protein n=1 Tax=Aequorivita marisscotiae TaxID=3040348 RepID=A0ABY8KRQ1_9FLAO|nr:fibronectin type III domain-containing protein [Aequorivita sp. Ant34-E75]WGF91697.1 fibronectin type III domain-containing protein [Aequorivita sp. Ant34-E75]
MKNTVLVLVMLFSITSWQTTAQFLESFDTEIPREWTVIDNDAQGASWQYHAGDGYRGAGGVRINFETAAHDDYLISPQFTVNIGVSDLVSLYAGGTGPTFPESFEVKLSTTGTNPSDFTVLLGSETTISDVDDLGDYINYTYNLTAYNGQAVYIAIVATATAAFHLYVDEFSVEALPRCPKPSNINFENLTATSLDLNWSAGNTETEWIVKYGLQGFDPETEGSLMNVLGTPNNTITDLQPGTVQDIYVKAVCGSGNGESEFAGPLRFITPCLTATIPFFEGFENGYTHNNSLDGCWTQELVMNSYWIANNTFIDHDRAPRTGDWDIFLAYGSEAWMFYPIEVQAGINYTLTFYARQSNTEGANIAVSYGISDSSRDMIHEIIPTTEITNGDYQEVSGTFTPATTGVFYIGIQGHVNTGFFPFFMTLDDISITETQACVKPTNLQINATTATTADISWSPSGTETDWLVKYGEPGFNPETEGDSAQVRDNPNVSITNLIPAHIYSVYVQAQCGGSDGNSFFTGPITLKTNPINDYLCDATHLIVDEPCSGSTFTNVGGTLENNEPQGSCFDAPGDQTVWFSFEAPLSGNVTVTTDFEGGTLEDTEVAVYEAPTDCSSMSTLGMEVGCDEDGGNTGTGFLSVVTLTNLAPGDTYYVQVNGFISFNDGTMEGTFCIEVQDNGISCPVPTDITFDNITVSTADVSWTVGDRENEWEIVYGDPGFDPDAGGTSVIDNDGFLGETLVNLNPDTTYDVYVRALCGANDMSEFSQVASFTTLLAPPINDNVCNAIHLIVDEVCAGNTYTNIAATVERDEPEGSCFLQLPTNTVWFTFEAPTSGNVTVTTNITPSNLIDSQMAVYEAPIDCADLTTMGVEIGCNDDIDFGNNELLSAVVLTALTAGETYYVQINGNSGNEGDFCIEVRDDGIACPEPTDITLANVTSNTADVSWTAGGIETEWEIKYGAPGFDPNTTGLSVIDNDGLLGETLIGLDSNTTYDLYVRAVCGIDTESDFVGPESFSTLELGVVTENFSKFIFYPNPVKNQITLKADLPIERVLIYNLLGQNIMELKENTPQMQLNTSMLQQGVYFMKVAINGDERIFRILKE